jgi:hypothetical protein
METGEQSAGNPPESQQKQAASSQIGRPPPIVLTSEVNLIALQKQLKDIAKGSFEFRSTRNEELSQTKWQTLRPSGLTSSPETSITPSTQNS